MNRSSSRAQESRTLLFWATEQGKVECLRLLLRFGGNKEAQGKGARTPLHAAAAAGFADCIRELINAGADKEAKDKVVRLNVCTPLLADEPSQVF